MVLEYMAAILVFMGEFKYTVLRVPAHASDTFTSVQNTPILTCLFSFAVLVCDFLQSTHSEIHDNDDDVRSNELGPDADLARTE